jgi:NADH-quinone oxidoreductase subunit M
LWGSAHRVGATVKFFLFSMAGSLFMLLALVGLYAYHADPAGAQIVGRNIDAWLFGAFVLAVAVKIPLIGLHTWLPDAHSASPTAANIILAGLLVNTGAYALLRFGFPLFPAAAHNAVPLLLLVALSGMVYFAWIAHAQLELKRMLAYAGIAHMSLVVVGLAVWNQMSLTGAVVQMINQGLTIPALFVLVGMLEERVPNHDLADFRGLWARMPLFSGFFLLFAMSAVGLPGLNHFIGEILILMGAFHKWPIVGIVGFAGLILTLVFVLGRVQTLLFGPVPEAVPAEDITGRELAILIPLAVAVLWIGLFPGTLLDLLAPELSRLADQLGGGLHSQPITPPGAL